MTWQETVEVNCASSAQSFARRRGAVQFDITFSAGSPSHDDGAVQRDSRIGGKRDKI
jgi:hypothetical protein